MKSGLLCATNFYLRISWNLEKSKTFLVLLHFVIKLLLRLKYSIKFSIYIFWDIMDITSLMNACWVSQSAFYQVLNWVSDGVFYKKMVFDEANIFHLKRIKAVLLLVKERFDTNYCQVQHWKDFVHVSITHQMSFWGAKNVAHETNKFCLIENRKAHIRDTIWFMISGEGMRGCMFLHWCDACMHTEKNITKISNIFSSKITFM